MKRLLVFVAGAVLFCCAHASADQFELKVPPLVGQRDIASIAFWDDRVVVVSEKYYSAERVKKYSFHYLDEEKEAIRPLVLKEGYNISAVAENGSFSFALCRKGNNLSLFRKKRGPGASWEIINLRDKIDLRWGAKLAVNKDSIFVVTPWELWYSALSPTRFRKVIVKSLFKGDRERSWLNRQNLPSAILATDDTLFLGYNVGEFGGAAYAVPLSKKGLSKTVLEIPEAGQVVGICKDAQGAVWIAGGCWHMGYHTAQLIRYSQGKSEVLVDQGAFGKEVDKLNNQIKEAFPPLAIDAMTISSRGRPIIVASAFGEYTAGNILEFWDGRLQSLVSANFSMTFRGELDSKLAVNTISFPIGIVVAGDNIYVAEYRLGVLKFIKNGERMEMHQFTFQE